MSHRTLADVISCIPPHSTVFIQGAVATPEALIKEMVAQKERLQYTEIIHLHTDGDAPYAHAAHQAHSHINTLFTAANLREAVDTGNADYIPVFLSEVPLLFRRGILPLDVALIHVSPPDVHGYCSLGTSVDVVLAALECAPIVLAQINPHMPRTHGDGFIHVSQITAWTDVDTPLPEHRPSPLSAVQKQIGEHCASLIDDGSTLQMGIGGIPDAVLSALGNHQDLGIHSEMFSDGIIDLVEKGVINGSKKKIHPHKIVAGFAMGTQRLYEFMHDNPRIAMLDIAYVNRTDVICRNPKVVAINSALEVDFTGQVCADSIGTYQFSGVGGQMDFIRGASLSEGGKPIIALPSTTRKGESRIAAMLKPGANVVTTRAHVHYIVTEYGVAQLYGKNLRERAKALIGIANPEHQASLEKQAYARFKSL